MNHRQLLNALALFVVIAALGTAAHAQSQPECHYADIRLDTDQPVDAGAICNAARPWADDGFRVFILLTDYRPESEDDWFAFLDQAEADAGLRDLSQPDSFDKNALALEASTATDLSWAYSVTYGERLFGTALDADKAIFQIKSQMRNAIAAGDPTNAFIQALSTSYEINHPPPSPWINRIKVGLIALVVGVLAVGGLVLALVAIIPVLRRVRQRMKLQRHLEGLRARTSNLLNACGQLLKGDTPEETVLYQLFSAYGGERYKEIRTDVREWLRRSQAALNDAFDLRQKLIDPSVQEKRPLEQRVRDWEMLYVTFVGNSERILALTDDELRTLLDPMLVLDREAADVQLAEQLDGIRRELTGMPLKVELMMVDPAKSDAEGILGYIDRVKAQIARLQEAQREAPERLAEAKTRRREAGEDVPSPFVLTEKQLFAGIDERLGKAEAALKQELFLRVMEQTAGILRDIGTVRAFVTAMSDHERRQAGIDAITAQDYRPDHLADDLQEVEADVQAIAQKMTAGDYVAAASWIEELNADSQRALAGAQEWQSLHEQNEAALQHLRDEVSRVEQYQAGKVEPAWQTLQTYPQSNWADVADGMAQATQTLQSLREDVINQIARLNSMEEQKFAEAEHKLAQALADLAQAEQQFLAVVNHLAEVQAAEAHIQKALRLAEADLARAEALRDKEDVKIGPEVDKQIKKARRQLIEARQLMEDREFLAAINEQAAARQLATAAYASASEQVREINTLQKELETTARKAGDEVNRCLAQARALPAVAQTAETNKLVQRVTDGFSQAQQARAAFTALEDRALAKALRTAIAAYDKVSQLADQALQRIAANRREYNDRLIAARGAVSAAQAAVQRAERSVRDSDAGGAGRHALQRARSTLPLAVSLGNATKSALARIRQQANEAQRYAEQAERQARQRIRAVQAERSRQRRRAERRSVSSLSSVSSASRGSSRRERSRSSSKRQSSRGSSRRQSSRGSSKRESSRGSSRRR
ncbi:MAG: hypothetical protein DRI52_03310 [Chloroflexi bacterium]|nr:MAG: hypothetical protein DRI52_03310 [Chloroflexota bacterium]